MAKKKPSTQNYRSQLRAQQAAAAKAKRRNRIIIAVAGLVILALIPVGVVALGRNTPPPVTPTTSPTGTQTPELFIPPHGTSEMGWIEISSPNVKPNAIVVGEHIDYFCSHCQEVHIMYGDTFMELAARGDIILRVHLRSFMGSSRVAMASTCADTVDAFGPYHQLVFTTVIEEGRAGLTDERLRNDFPATLGITGEDLTKFQTCFDTQQTLNYVTNMESVNLSSRTINGGDQDPPEGTPAYFINSKPMLYSEIVGINKEGTQLFPTQDNSPDGFLEFLKTVAAR